MNIEDYICSFWRIVSITDRDGSEKKNRKRMYELWMSDSYLVNGLHAHYYPSGYTIEWNALILMHDGVDVQEGSHTSLVERIEEREDGFTAYTASSIYEFRREGRTIQDVYDHLEKAESQILQKMN